MTEWLSGTLDDLCEVEYGTRVTRKRDGGTKYPVYGGGGATFNLDDFNREDQMIVSRFAMSEECVRFVPGKFFLNDSGLTVRTRDGSKMSQEFLDQQLLARSNEIYATARGTAQKNMDMTMFRNMELAIPDSLEEQKRIVALLDAATARVTELTACYEQARTHANNLFTSALREALESNPDWPVKTLGEVAVVNPSEPALSEEAPFVPMDAVTAGKRDVQYTQPRGQRSGARARAGDILFARITPCLQNGKVALVQDEIARCSGSTEFIVVRASSEILNGYLYQWITSDHIRDEVTALMKGATGRQRLNAADLALTELPVPSLDEQKRIVGRLDAMRAKTSEMVAAYDAKLQAAKNLRQSILESAFEGKL